MAKALPFFPLPNNGCTNRFGKSHHCAARFATPSMLQNVTTSLMTKKYWRKNQPFHPLSVTFVYKSRLIFSALVVLSEIHRFSGKPLPIVTACGKLEYICGKNCITCGNSGESLGKNWDKNKNCKARPLSLVIRSLFLHTTNDNDAIAACRRLG